ncbi:MAG: hypothetical protein QOC55_141 [Thermoleophilaceae bacterium]|nr:hypothetical protein [Thermoleophilaceae bacterium]
MLDLDGHEIPFSNRGKIFWPVRCLEVLGEHGLTPGERGKMPTRVPNPGEKRGLSPISK